jgi:spermidine/putrescine transport system permease protein
MATPSADALAPVNTRAKRRWSTTLLRALAVVPAVAWISLLVVVPLAIMVVFSLWEVRDYRIDHAWTIDQYRATVGSHLWRTLLVRTLTTALIVATIATAIGLPLAWFVSQRLRRAKALALILLLLPLWVSFLLRAYSWKVILGDRGILNTFLMDIGLITEPLSALLYSRTAVVIALLYVSIPFVFAPIFVAFERIPKELLWASRDLGGSGIRTFTHVAVPLALPGIVTGFAFAFVISVGDFVTPTLVGGTSGTMIGALIVSQFGLAFNWPLGAAMALVLFVVVLVFLALVQRLVRVEAKVEA